MDLSALSSIEPAQLRVLLPAFLAGFITEPAAREATTARVGAYVSDWDDETCRRVVRFLASIGDEERVYYADPECRHLARVWSEAVITDRTLEGVEHLQAAVASGPTIVLCNHLSYYDSTAIDALLTWHGHEALANRMMSAAGPKVYQALFRRVAAACLNTLPVPQSTSIAHAAQLGPRELARKALASLDAAADAMSSGYVLLLYPEGSRSRSARMGPFLKAVHRYLKVVDGLSVVPAAITGTHRLMPVDDEHMHPGPAALRFGEPLPVGADLQAKDALAITHEAIARLLAEEHRPEPGAPALA